MPDKPKLRYSMLRKGMRFRPFVLQVSEEFVRAFARAVGDENPIYFDDAAARAAGFPAAVAPAAIAGIYARRAYLEDYVMPGGGVLIRHDFEFLRPVLVGDTITAVAEVEELYARKGRPVARMRTEAKNQDGELLGIAALEVIWPTQE